MIDKSTLKRALWILGAVATSAVGTLFFAAFGFQIRETGIHDVTIVFGSIVGYLAIIGLYEWYKHSTARSVQTLRVMASVVIGSMLIGVLTSYRVPGTELVFLLLIYAHYRAITEDADYAQLTKSAVDRLVISRA